MASKYEQKINQMAETLARIDERIIGLLNRLYDKDGDIPHITEHLKAINGRCSEHDHRINQNTTSIKNNPLTFLGKKWFWAIVAIVVLFALGCTVADIRGIIGLLTGT